MSIDGYIFLVLSCTVAVIFLFMWSDETRAKECRKEWDESIRKSDLADRKFVQEIEKDIRERGNKREIAQWEHMKK